MGETTQLLQINKKFELMAFWVWEFLNPKTFINIWQPSERKSHILAMANFRWPALCCRRRTGSPCTWNSAPRPTARAPPSSPPRRTMPWRGSVATLPRLGPSPRPRWRSSPPYRTLSDMHRQGLSELPPFCVALAVVGKKTKQWFQVVQLMWLIMISRASHLFVFD